LSILSHRHEVVSDSAGLWLQIQDAEGDTVEPQWVREEAVEPAAVRAYLASVGQATLQKATDKKRMRAQRDSHFRKYVRQAMVDMTQFWEALTPEERQTTLALHSADHDLTAVACGTHKEGGNEKVMLAKTAGILCACLSSGVVILMQECFGAESLSQRYFFIAELKRLYPELKVVVHDDACHLRKFAEARASDSEEAAILAGLKYVCDEFHMANHTDAWCLAHCHPGSPDVAEVMKDVRTSVCEFTFTWLSQYKHQTKHMSEFTFKWFLMEMIDTHNAFILKGVKDHLPKVVRRAP